MPLLSTTGWSPTAPRDNNSLTGRKKGTTNSSRVDCWHLLLVVPCCSVIWSASDDFLAGWPQQYGVFKLCRVAALDITKWGVRDNNA